MRDLTPREIVKELDRHIVGQDDAKRAVAVAIRNRWRRQRVAEDMRAEVAPKNIMMIGAFWSKAILTIIEQLLYIHEIVDLLMHHFFQ